MIKIENEYGFCYKDREDELIRARYKGNYYVKATEQLMSLTKDEYQFAFTEGVNYFHFREVAEQEGKIPIYLLYGSMTRDQIDYINSGAKVMEYKNINESIDIEVEQDIKVEYMIGQRRCMVPFESLPYISKDTILYGVSNNMSSGSFIDKRTVDHYIIPGLNRTIEAEGSITSLIDQYNDGKVNNIESFMAALSDAKKYNELDRVEKESGTLEFKAKIAEKKASIREDNKIQVKKDDKEMTI